MRILYSLFLALSILLCGAIPSRAQYPASCDKDKSCVGTALTTQVTSGKGAQYVDVDSSYQIRALSNAITFETWVKPSEQPGMRQFVGGLWGPNKDDNDQWVLYIEDNRIVFELSADGTRLQDVDNTVAIANVPDLYTRGWLHIAAVWDSGSTAARIFVDGIEVARATNATYPVKRLHPVANKNLLMQIGSCNGLYDDPNRFRTFLGQMDEVRLWSRALSDDEVRCQKDLSLNGNEAGMVLYYRCNEGANSQTLCDATGHNITGLMRSGAQCTKSNRTIPLTYTVTPTTASGTLICTSDTTLTFTITDTSYCGSRVSIQIAGRDRALFSVSPNQIVLTQNTPRTFTVRMQATIIGTIVAEVQVFNSNRCRNVLRIPLNFVRKTELEYSDGQIELDTLYVGCVERPYEERKVTVTNIVGRGMKLDSITLRDSLFSWRPENAAQNLPYTIPVGGTWSFYVRMKAADTTTTSYDTIRIYSDDRCPGSGVIPIVGNTVDVLLLLKGSGNGRIDSMKFEAVCPGQISNVQTYQYRSGVSERITIDTIEFDEGFFGRKSVYPIPLDPMTAYQATFVRFKPTRPGPFAGEMRVRTSYRGCTIVKKIYLTGRGIDVNFNFDNAVVGFGNVTIGKISTQSVGITNLGDPRKLSAYLKMGDVFRIVGPRSFNLGTGGTATVTVEFRPREPITYYDTLCLFDEQCYGTVCIPISGTGVFEALSFSPSYLSIENVIGCTCHDDSITVTNITSGPLTITSAVLNDATGKFTLVSGPSSGTLQPNESYKYLIRYCPNDLNDDRTDVAYIDISLDDGQKYQVLMRANSAVPKIYVTELTTYGLVEVGGTKTEKILIENISNVPLQIDAINPPPGFTVIATSRPLPATLNPRDSLMIDVQFAPTQETAYDGYLNVVSTSPCGIVQSGRLTGRGIIYRLDVPVSFINFGLIRPCDCSLREIPLPNYSSFKPITIDSIWIDGRFLTNPNPIVYSWRSKQTGASTLPYTLAPGTIDTLIVSFCPNIPATQANLVADGKLHISAHTVDWNSEDTVTMSGRREMNFQPNRTVVTFPNIRAGFSSPPQIVELTVPDQFVNPSGDSLVVTDITFSPDQRVFTAVAVNGDPFPWVVHRNEKFQIQLVFTPRAPRSYVARMHIHTSFPCNDVDTTVLVQGMGFAFPYGMRMTFDTTNNGVDTFQLTTCDTLRLPIITDREMPQDRIDVEFHIGFDSTIAQLVDVTSRYTTNIAVVDSNSGVRVYLREANNVVADTIAWARFVPKVGDTTFTVYLDDADLDSDSLVLYKIVVPPDSAVVSIAQPRIAVTQSTRFDTVNVKSCADRIVAVSNPGRIPIRFDSLSLPLGHRVTASSQPYPTMIAPGDTIFLTVTFCPFREELYDTTITVTSNLPCVVIDTGRVLSFGYAPPFPMRLALDANIGIVDTIRGTIADTVEMPIIIDRDIPQTPLDVRFTLGYNRRALQYLGISSSYTAAAAATEQSGGLRVELPGCDSIVAGEIARLRFRIAVPDSTGSAMRLQVTQNDFTSDSAFWVKLIPQGDTGAVVVDARCNITRLNFRGGATKLSPPVPNPASGTVAIEIEFFEDAQARLTLYNSAGVEVTKLLDGNERLTGGRYRLELDTRELPEGTYYYILEAGHFSATEKLQIVR